MRVPEATEEAELISPLTDEDLSVIPEESIYLQEEEAVKLRRLFQCAHASHPGLSFSILSIAISPIERVFSYIPTKAERDALCQIPPASPLETQFLSLVQQAVG